METLYDTLPLVPEGKRLSQLWVGLLIYSDRKYNLNLTGISNYRMMNHTFVKKRHIKEENNVYQVVLYIKWSGCKCRLAQKHPIHETSLYIQSLVLQVLPKNVFFSIIYFILAHFIILFFLKLV